MPTTKEHKKYWANRKIDWDAHYLQTWNHPHRELIVYALTMFPWISLWEVGCGPGANLVKISKHFEKKQLGGSDINPDAIALANKTFIGAKFHVEPSDDILLSDNSVDVVVSDAHLIYHSPADARKVIKEMVRVARNFVVIFEYHERKWWKRLWCHWKTGYYAHNYRQLLEEAGCFKVQIVKMPAQYWPDTNWVKYGHIIIARVPSIHALKPKS